MKRNNLLLSIFCVCMLLAGCNTNETPEAEDTTDISEQHSGMVLITEEANGPYDKTIAVYRNIYTDVLYLWIDGYKCGGLVEMHNPTTGCPLTYEKYKDFMEDQ